MRKLHVLLLLTFFGLASAQVLESDRLLDSLQPKSYVTDTAGVFQPEEAQKLEQLLFELDRRTGNQIAVVVLPTLEGGEIRDFSSRLFEKWGIGRKAENRGVLVLASIGDRKIWVEVGYGLEGILPDARVGRILDETVIPFFRTSDYAGGLTQGTLAIVGIVAEDSGLSLPAQNGEKKPLPDQPRKLSLFEIILLLVFLAIFIPVVIKHPWILLLLLNSGGGGGSGGGFGRGGGFGGFGGGLSGGGGAGRSW